MLTEFGCGRVLDSRAQVDAVVGHGLNRPDQLFEGMIFQQVAGHPGFEHFRHKLTAGMQG